ncbi:MAG: SAM-dependent DNA methyltransferase [Treponema sp.]|nr:SAM-dependent DNA methyltransferase [Treponema sp.]
MDLGQVFTNKLVAEYMTSLFSLEKSACMLDPCFGNGSFLSALQFYGYLDITGCEIDYSLFMQTKDSFSSAKLLNKDFLSSFTNKKFDGIIMNPPYVRQEKIDNLSTLGVSKTLLRQNPLFSELPSTANLYMYFIVKAISLLAENGELIVIFPGSWLTARSGKQFEKVIYAKCSLVEQIFMSGDVFEKDVLTDVIIWKLKKSKISSTPIIKYIKFENSNFTEYSPKLNDLGLDFSKKFESYGVIRRGMTTGYNSMYINPPLKNDVSRKYLKKILSSPKEIIGYSTKNSKPDNVLVLNSTDSLTDELKDYIQKYQNEIQTQCTPKTLYYKMQSDENWFAISTVNSSGILFSYFVRNDMKFVYNESDYLARDNFYIIRQKDSKDSLLLFALLNNYYTFYQLEKIGKKYGAGLLKLQRYDLENLRFPDISEFSQKDVESLKSLSLNLISNNDSKAVSDITKVISQYSNVKYDILLKEYHSIKSHRLGSAYVG